MVGAGAGVGAKVGEERGAGKEEEGAAVGADAVGGAARAVAVAASKAGKNFYCPA